MPPALMEIAPADAEARLAYGPHPSQFVDFRRASTRDPRPLVVMIHGGFWRLRRALTYAGHLCVALGECGFATANIEYRRLGEDGAGWPGTFEDVKRAVEFALVRAPEFGGDTERAVVMGHSAGGHLALLASAEFTTLRGAISLAGVVNLRRAQELHLGEGVVDEFMGGSPIQFPQLYREADPVNLPAGVPRVLIHGSDDDIVPAELSRNYPDPRRYIEITGADHYALIDPATAAWRVVFNELTSLTSL